MSVPSKEMIEIAVRRCGCCQRNLMFEIETQPLRTVIIYKGDECAICRRVLCAVCAYAVYIQQIALATVCHECGPTALARGYVYVKK